MTRTLELLRKFGLLRAASVEESGSRFDKRLQRINAVRELADAPSSMFKNRPTPSKA